MDALIWICLTALAIALPLYYPRWSLQRALKRPLPPESLQVLRRNIAVYDRMPAELQQQLQRLVLQFLHQKKFIGCAGLEVDDEMAVTIAGQACMLLLNRSSKVYPSLHTILLYPSAFVAQRPRRRPRRRADADAARPCWANRGATAASCCRGTTCRRGAEDWSDGHNVVLHEFAHQLDSESGASNGAPYLGNTASYRSWATVLSRDFESLRFQAVHRMQSVMDHYGATNPAEFFAVATETFFEKPHQMAESHAELYAEFQKYYRVDPRDWQDAPPPAAAGTAASAAGFITYAPAW